MPLIYKQGLSRRSLAQTNCNGGGSKLGPTISVADMKKGTSGPNPSTQQSGESGGPDFADKAVKGLAIGTAIATAVEQGSKAGGTAAMVAGSLTHAAGPAGNTLDAINFLNGDISGPHLALNLGVGLGLTALAAAGGAEAAGISGAAYGLGDVFGPQIMDALLSGPCLSGKRA